MPNLVYPGQSTPGGYLASRIRPPQTVTETLDSSSDIRELTQKAAQETFNTKYDEHMGESFAGRIMKYGASAGIDTVDTVASVLPGIERGDVWSSANDMGMTGLADWQARNKSGVEMGSALITGIAAGYLTETYILGSMGARLLASTGMANMRVIALGPKLMQGARESAIAAQEAAALSGGAANIWAPGMRGLTGMKALTAASRGLASEITISFAGQNNEAIWSDSAANNAFWMAIGVAVPAGFGALQGRAELRALANEDRIVQMRTKALDPHEIRKDRDILADPSVPYNPDLELIPTAQITSHALGAKATIPTGASEELKNRLSGLAKQEQSEMESSFNKFVVKGIPDAPAAKKIPIGERDDLSIKRHLIEALGEDPTILSEVVSIGTGIPENVIKSRENVIHNLKMENTPEGFKAARRLEKQTPEIIIGKHRYPASQEAKEFAAFDPSQTKLVPTAGVPFEYRVQLPSSHIIKVNPAAKIAGFTSMPLRNRLASVQVLRKLSATMLSGKKGTRPGISLHPGSDWLQLEFGAYHKMKGGDVNTSKLGANTVEEIRFAGLKAKIAQMKADKIYGHYLNPWDRMKYNLPEASQLERIEDGSSKALYSVLDAVDGGKIKDYDSAKALYNQILQRAELVGMTRTSEREFYGNMFDFNYSKEGKWYQPAIVYTEQKQFDLSKRGLKAQLTEEIANNKLVVFHELMSGNATDSIVKLGTTHMHTTPEGMMAVNMQGIADDMVTGQGSGPASEAASLLPVGFRARDSKLIQAVYRLAQQMEDLANSVTKRMMESLGDMPKEMAAFGNRKSMTLYNAFATFRPGWDTTGKWTKDSVDGLWRVTLKDTPHNAKRLGRKVVKGEFLKNHTTGQDLVLDQKAKDMFDGLTALFERQRMDENRLRRAMGLSEIRHTPDFIPSESTKGKFIAFVINSKGEVVPGKTIVTATADEFARRKAKGYAGLASGEYLHTRQEIEHTQDLFDSAQQEWIDSAFVARQNNPNRGMLVGDEVRNDLVREHLRYIQDKNLHLANSTMRTVLDDQIKIAKMRRVVENNESGSRSMFGAVLKSSSDKTPPHTIFDDYLKAVAGPVIGDVKERRLTRLVSSVEGPLQVVANAVWSGLNSMPVEQASDWIKDMASRVGAGGISARAQTFQDLTKDLGKYMPYQSLDDYATQITKGKRPPEVREIAAALNRWDATWRLRYLEIPNAAMNLLGIINNMPSILGNSNTPVLGQLVSHSGKKVGVVDAMKLIMQGTRETLKKTHTADWEYAERHGGLEQGVAEVRRTMSAIEDQSSWRRAFFGDKTIKNPKRFTKDWVKYHGVDGLTAIANDGTEKWSRMWAHGIGLKLADLQGISGEAARFNFANSIADAAIANYSPLNRGEMYHTALGSMMGLYQTYAMNYSNRMFRWAEKGDYRAITRQIAAQSAMFGVSSNIGWNQFSFLEDHFTSDDATISDMIYARFGPQVGSLIAHGGIADLPRLLGADTGVALYQRADSNIRSNILQEGLTIDPIKAAAALGSVKQVAGGIWDIGASMWSDDSITSGQLVSEQLANAIPNRMLRGALTVGFNDGLDVDRYGAVMSSSKGFFESSLRVLGLRSTRQQDEIDFKYQNRAYLDGQASKMEDLRTSARALVRNGTLPDRMGELFEHYKQAGGNPIMYKSWVRQIAESGEVTRTTRELKKALNSPKNQAVAARDGWVD